MISILLVIGIGIQKSYADVLIELGSARSVLTQSDEKSIGSVILIPGGHGRLQIDADGNINKLRGNQLVRTRHLYAEAGVTTLTVDREVNLAQAIKYMRKLSPPVIVVATSRGATRAHKALGAKPDGLVLTSAMLDKFQHKVKNPAKLPKTLVIHHVKDMCHVTLPALVAPFKKWGGDKVQVKWIDGGCDHGHVCRALSHHGFNCQDQKIVDIIVSFLKKQK